MKRLLLLLVCVCLISLTSAQSVVKQDIEFDLRVPFIVNGTTPSASATCNVTIEYPNSTLLANGISMTRNANGVYNFTVVASNTSTLGTYEWVTYCCDGAKCASGSDSFEITRSGRTLTTANGIIYLFVIFGLLTLLGLCIWGSIKVPWRNYRDAEDTVISLNNLRYLKMFLIFVSYLVLLYLFSTLNDVSKSFLFLEGVSSFFNIVYVILLVSLAPLVIAFVGLFILSVIVNRKYQEMFERGFNQ